MIPSIAVEIQDFSSGSNSALEMSATLGNSPFSTKNSLTVRMDTERMQSERNIAHFRKISHFGKVKNNWDNEGALAPSSEAVSAAKRFVEDIDRVGLDVFFTSYGRNGEVLVEIKNDKKAIEFYFENNKNEYAAFQQNKVEREGNISKDEFRKVIQWFNFGKWI